MAKGQKKSNREIRKPKQEKPKAAEPSRTFLTPQDRTAGGAGSKGSRR